ncbi:MAG TPA: sulfatase-like hydrolase/transferase [Terriglobales bacterium]|nr:sulfatase-like hydrolase/transferase [Terriglobales bacterium]
MLFLRRRLCLVLLVACTIATTVAESQTKSPPQKTASPNVILITLDTTRADRMGFLGSKRGLTPNLDALARQSVIFTRAYSQVPLTTASHATILTGTYPQFHQVNDFGVPLAPGLPYGPDIFHSRGYHTAAFVGSLVLDPETRSAPGFERGFDTYDAGFHRRRPDEDRYQAIERRGGEVIGHSLAWLTEHHDGPFFVWIHLYDAHDPYDPPEPYKTRYASTPYDGEIAYDDAALGQFFKWLRLRGLFDDSLIALMADHGEGLGDHGETTHGIFLYDETIHVPLLFKLPRGRSAGSRVDERAGLVDVLPTILDAAGIEVPRQVQGESLLTLIRPVPSKTKPGATKSDANPVAAAPSHSNDRPANDRPAYAESDYPHRTFGWSSLRSLRTGKYLFVDAPRKELYDQSNDPNATHNLSGSSAAVTNTLASQLDAFREKTSTTKEAPKVAADPGLQERLNALGYVATDSTSAAMPGIKDTGADPKDKVEVVNLLHRAEMAKEETHFQEAVPLLEKVIELEPSLPITYLQLGTALTSMHEYERALPILRKAVEMRPDLTVPRYQLGSALFETGDFAGAAVQFETTVARSPNWPEAHLSLATAYARLDRLTDAIPEYEKVIAIRPKHYSAHLLLGRALALSGNPAAAVPNLLAAAELQPKSPEPHRFLADAYVQLGQQADADREQATAQRLLGSRGQ